jgi:membrane dipeptidase
MLLFDGHLDISMNAVEFNRDVTKSLKEIRDREAEKLDYKDRGKGILTLDEMRKGQIGICIATQIARYVAPDTNMPGWNSPDIAWAITQAQLAWYRVMEDHGQMKQITNRDELNAHVDLWKTAADQSELPIGYILSLEGADSIINLGYLETAYAYGLRALGPAHYGPGRYAPGTGSEGGLESGCKDLLLEMQRLGIVLDVTHLTDEGFWEALDIYSGPIWASHQNCRALVPHQRQFSDEQIKAIIERDAVIGMAFDAWMMVPDWQRGVTQPYTAGVNLERIIEHVDHICQLAGNTKHVGIGSDLDGGYGREQCPYDMESIADLRKLIDLLAKHGYSESDVEGMMHGNWIRRLNDIWSS